VGAIHDGHARTSPGRAVGLLFVPLFGSLWAFRVFPGFATDFNRFVDRHGLEVAKLPGGVFTAFVVLSILSILPVVGTVALSLCLVVGLVMVSRICDAVNAARAEATDHERVES